jgi:hypothetical protein
MRANEVRKITNHVSEIRRKINSLLEFYYITKYMCYIIYIIQKLNTAVIDKIIL